MDSPEEKLSFAEKALGAAERGFNLLWSSDRPQDIWHWLLLIFILVVGAGIVLIFVLKTLGNVIELLVKFSEAYKTSGLPVWLSKQNKSRVRRRKQFCAVLDADLAYLAKAENWNDQYFTDLEAEVETEGGYYASALDRLRRKKSFGLRKERSLIRAINSSTERAMQLVGEPGSGKSVALRHLAKQFAEQGRKSNDKNATVPLYINLREMDISDTDAVNADSVREFVLENIRRGDADTSAFVKENWDDYCNRGIWLFLFDSFDEIPAVLHSAAGSHIIRHYSQAIRQFLEGMGECQGILASREFKGPEALPWKKLRILPLSGEKQDELIRNSFLNEHQMDLVRQHLASSHSSIGATPLFLTLLCRYVRDEQRAPGNDHDILLQHIERLARREPDYLKRKYHLTPEELIAGAERLARLFAENDTMSLAPSLDQIVSQLPAAEITGGSIERLVSALVDSKIGRADVPNAAQGDRRFAFAHRRYQESLFVRYLTGHPEILSAAELLTEARWREYTVTLLQTRNFDEIKNLLSHASAILRSRAEKQIYIACVHSPLPDNLAYYEWSSEVAVPLLGLLQEGLALRLKDVPQELSSAIEAFLKPRWENGDDWDRCEVLRLGGLLPQDTLVEYLIEAFSHGTELERLHAFKQAGFTSELPDIVRNAVLKMLSTQVILAENRADQLTIEAMAARLPPALGANFVVSRGKRLRRHLRWVRKSIPSFIMVDNWKVINGLLAFALTLLSTRGGAQLPSQKSKNEYTNLNSEIDLAIFFSALTGMWAMFLIAFMREPSGVTISSFILSSVVLVSSCIIFSPFLVRDKGKKITLRDTAEWLSKNLITWTFFRLFAIFMISVILFLTASTSLGFMIYWSVNKYISPRYFNPDEFESGLFVLLGVGFILALSYVGLIITILIKSREKRLQRNKSVLQLTNLLKTTSSPLEIICLAKDYEQLLCWLQYDLKLFGDVHSVRTLSSFILSILRREKHDPIQLIERRPVFFKSKASDSTSIINEDVIYLNVPRQSLEDHIVEYYK